MNNRDRRTISIAGHDRLIQVTDDGSRTLIHPDTGVAYHSASGAAAETNHVYLTNSGVVDRCDLLWSVCSRYESRTVASKIPEANV